MAQNINDYLRSAGFNVNVGDYEDNPTSKKSAVTEALKTQHSYGNDLKGNAVNLNEGQANYIYNSMFNKNGDNKYLLPKEAEKANKMFAKDYTRSQGKMTLGPGSTGYGFGWQGNRTASRGNQLLSAVADTPGLMYEGTMNSLGIVTAQQRLQYKSSNNWLVKGMAVAPAILGGGFLMQSMINGDDLYDSLAFNLTGAAATVGFHAGKSIAGAITPSAKKEVLENGKTVLKGGKLRLGLQAVGGGLGAGVALAGTAALTYGLKDLTSSESSIAKAARSYTNLTDSASTMQNNSTLTMRQKALQQLSQSALNDRGSILGNESAILKGYL